MNKKVIIESLDGTLKITTMVFMILVGSKAFSQILAFSGASTGLINAALGLDLPPIVIIIMMQLVILFLGCFMEVVSIMMVTLPIFLPIILKLFYDKILFAVLFLVAFGPCRYRKYKDLSECDVSWCYAQISPRIFG